ncbi:MAG TPA: hypothetical protein VK582_23650 [Pyrinomonadaceae bacterium]|nr:hypothetical protein [Pyrinomonadaceae bacterium]
MDEMFIAYFDASGAEEQEAMTVAGYVSTVERWERFKTDWKLVLAHYNVPHFHMREFAGSVRHSPFESWKGKEGTRRAFLTDLVDVTKTHVFHSFGATVLMADYNYASKRYALSRMAGNAYSFCGRACAAKLNRWMKANGHKDSVRFVFDRGDLGKGVLTKVFMRDGFSAPEFEQSRDGKDGSEGTLPLQTADFAAWEISRLAKHTEAGLLRSLRDVRGSFKALSTISNTWDIYTRDKLVGFCIRYLSARSPAIK